ncbi:MAG: hypothetical protein L0Y74_07455 [candidate division Zixibacteria bacterium]|nr:hypothetical protein [candidate division Zixibacteria bacterium]
MKSRNRKSICNLLLVSALLFSFCFQFSCGVKPQKDAYPTPTPETMPVASDSLQVIEGLSVSINLYMWQNYMPPVPESGPPLYLSLQLEVTNRGETKVSGFNASKLILFPHGSDQPYHAFKLVSLESDPKTEILPGETGYYTYTNDREEVFSPALSEWAKFYARIELGWNGRPRILTSPPVAVEFVY